MTVERPTVIVVDDHELFRRGLVGVLVERGIRVVADTSLAREAIELVTERDPDVVLMDLNMPGMSGIEATQRLTVIAPLKPVVMITVMADEDSLMDALLAGACGYVLKDQPIDQIVEAIRAAARGESLISPRIASRLVHRIRAPNQDELAGSDPKLTPRELEVLKFVARGIDNREIARSLFLSEHTVKNHVSNILLKLQVENRIQAAVRAVRGRLV
ncbi:MAG: response regulator transcription factor [Solirubrobacterales bacterium]|nr:response regulator transcription factor [Solirubrobacterales bacterium]MBV9941643.1 response regulator transcription factor [Solirubrobacterales bacterium]